MSVDKKKIKSDHWSVLHILTKLSIIHFSFTGE